MSIVEEQDLWDLQHRHSKAGVPDLAGMTGRVKFLGDMGEAGRTFFWVLGRHGHEKVGNTCT